VVQTATPVTIFGQYWTYTGVLTGISIFAVTGSSCVIVIIYV